MTFSLPHLTAGLHSRGIPLSRSSMHPRDNKIVGFHKTGILKPCHNSWHDTKSFKINIMWFSREYLPRKGELLLTPQSFRFALRAWLMGSALLLSARIVPAQPAPDTIKPHAGMLR